MLFISLLLQLRRRAVLIWSRFPVPAIYQKKSSHKALVLGITHFFLQFLTTFYGIIFMGMPDPVRGSLRAVSMTVANRVTDVLTFPMVQLAYPFSPLDEGYKILLVFLANSILWTGCFYLLLFKITGLRQNRAKIR